jgi:outer membrane immunogenic protein
MKRILLALSALVIGTAAASAADLPARTYTKAPPPPPVPVFSWSGCYVGLNGGYGWGNNHSALAPNVDPAFWDPAFAAGAAPSFFSWQNSGGVAGGQLGCNWQTGAFVVGVETDFDWANVRGSEAINTPGSALFVPGFFSSGTDLRWLGTTRGRIGWAVNNWLFYATGGVAYGSVNHNLAFAFPATLDFQTIAATSTNVGWTAGAGVEWAFTNNWTVRAEYLYVDLGNQAFVSTPSGRAANLASNLVEAFSNHYNIVRVGVNYKFDWGWGSPPVAARY